MHDSEFDPELERIRGVYTRRSANTSLRNLYAPFSPAPMASVQGREWALATLMRANGRSDLSGLDILDIGCGSGVELMRFVLYGADPQRMVGIDLMSDRIEAARRLLPQAQFHQASAHRLAYPDSSFDLVTQFTTFSSVADQEMRRAIASEMSRVLRPTGSIFWYDVGRLRRQNADLVAIDLRELQALFPGRRIEVRPTTLEWSLIHRIAPRSRMLAQMLERIPVLCSHYAARISSGSDVARS